MHLEIPKMKISPYNKGFVLKLFINFNIKIHSIKMNIMLYITPKNIILILIQKYIIIYKNA